MQGNVMRTAFVNTSYPPKANQLCGKYCALVMFIAVLLLSTGCSLCAPGYLCDYAGVGGKWQRSDPENGRVGSIFSDPNSVVAASHQPAETTSPTEIYPDALDQSILEPSMGAPTDEGGVIILGDDW